MPAHPLALGTLLAIVMLSRATSASPRPAVGPGVAYEVEGSLAALSLARPGGGEDAAAAVAGAPDWSAVDEEEGAAGWAPPPPPPRPCASPPECRAACEGSAALAGAGADAVEAAVRSARARERERGRSFFRPQAV
jgi:hypothetical protein